MNLVCKNFFSLLINRKAMLLCGFIISFLFMSPFVLGDSGEDNNTNNQALIDQKIEEIKKIQAEINQYQSEINSINAEQRTLSNEIKIYDNNIYKNQLEIQQTKLDIEKTKMEIEQAKLHIVYNEEKIEEHKISLKYLLQALYEYQQDSMFDILISQDNISDFFNEYDAVESLQNEIFKTVNSIKEEREELIIRNSELENNQVAYLDLIDMRTVQNDSLSNLKQQKNEILEITHGEESEYQKLLSDNQSLLPSLRAELRDLQSLGDSIEFNDAISAAQYVGGVTGVRPAFLLGVLRVESSLGTNIGGGNYLVDMNPNQRATFEAITAELGYDPNSMPVSRKPTTYSGWGGAMGPAQMMPTTWRMYQAQASQITGHYPADPWNLTDSIAGMAVKLSAVEGVTSGDYNAEYKAAGMYFAGSNWQRFLFYPNKVMYYADLYEKELNES